MMLNKIKLISSFEFKQLIKNKSYKITTAIFFALALLAAFAPRLIQGNLFKSITEEFNKTQKLGIIINDDGIDESELKSFLSNYEVHLYTDEEKLKEVLNLEIDDEGNFYDPLSMDMDLDGVADRYDADFRDSKVQSIGDFDKKEKSSVMDRLDYFKEKVGKGELQDENTDRKIECKEEVR